MEKKPHYWFPAKRYGWGWGIPSTWQGWVTLVLYLVLIWAAHVLLLPVHDKTMYLGSVLSLTGILIAICWWKGEPPKWRWGGK